MFKLRRGMARLGWVLLGLWSAFFAFATVFNIVTHSSQHLTAPVVIVIVGVPLAIFLLWRLLIWIGEGFWQ
jgi:hypothetical protein